MKYVNYEVINQNIKEVKQFSNKDVMFVVKNDGYNTNIIKLIEHVKDVNYVMVSSVVDALKLSEHSDVTIYINAVLSREELKLIRFFNIEIMIDDINYVKENYDVLKTINVHLKVNTSMNRYGIDNVEDGFAIIEFCQNNDINIVGLLTHFSLEDECDEVYDLHVKKFRYFYEMLNEVNQFKIVHAENSYTMQKLDENLKFCNYVRCGIICYGYGIVNDALVVKPSYYYSGKVLKVRALKTHECYSYGLANKLEQDGLVAIIDVGYGDGLLRNRSDLNVIINNIKYPIIGKISMSNCYVLVDDSVNMFDEVVFYNDEITVEQHAKAFEVPTSLVMSYLK